MQPRDTANEVRLRRGVAGIWKRNAAERALLAGDTGRQDQREKKDEAIHEDLSVYEKKGDG
jgi:hypothetical protein